MILSFVIGFLPYLMTINECASSSQQAIVPPGDDESALLIQDPKYPRSSDMPNDHIYFSFYDGGRVFVSQDDVQGDVSRRPHKNEGDMLHAVRKEAVQFLENKTPGKYTEEKCKDIRYRTIPTIGMEADVFCNDNDVSIERVSLLLPFQEPIINYHYSIEPTTTINIIMPLRGKVDVLQLFIENLINILKITSDSVSLTVVYFEDEHVEEVRQILAEAELKTSKHLRTQFILIGDNPAFSRGRGLQVGVDKTTLPGEVMFFCDVDVLFTKDFLTRCMSTPVLGYQVFFPMIFSLYNPELIYPFYKQVIPPPLEQLYVGDDHGFWRVWGHGMVCVYKSDFNKIGRFDEKRKGWGGEDNAMHHRTVSKKYKVIRSLDYGLFHRYHSKECGDAHERGACIRVKSMTEASRQALALWYFKQQEGALVYGALAQPDQSSVKPDQSSVFISAARTKVSGLNWYIILLSILVLIGVAYLRIKLRKVNTMFTVSMIIIGLCLYLLFTQLYRIV